MNKSRFVCLMLMPVLFALLLVGTAYGFDPSRYDQYGGLLRVRGTATGFFHVEKIGNRYWFVTPEGHGFWSIGVNFVSDFPNDGHDKDGKDYMKNILKKYGSKFVWAPETSKKILGWKFNTIGAGSSSYIDPNGAYHRKPTEPRIVKAYKKRFGLYAHTKYGVANILKGLKSGGFFPDVFDPRFAEWVEKEASSSYITGGLEVESKSPWILGYYTDEELRGFGSKKRHVHLGWAATAASPDTYTKRAWRDFLKEKYGTLEALNAAYGTAYTTWDSNGTSGVLDEKGLGHHIRGSSNPVVKEDQDDFLYRIARRYFEITSAAMRKYHPNHLILGPMFSTWDSVPRDEVLLAAKDLIDVFGVSADADHRYIYQLTGKPTMVYTWWITAEPDSPLQHPCNNEPTCVQTQEERGVRYMEKLHKLVFTKGNDGTYIVLGAHWWKYSDNGIDFWREQRNFGLVTIKDNAYDGREARRRRTVDSNGFEIGGEPGDYGDFLRWVARANRHVMRRLERFAY